MWNGKKKAVTFSFDDGVSQDVRLIELLNKYGLKATFNINSGKLGLNEIIDFGGGRRASHYKVSAPILRDVYQGHEIAAHSLTHPSLTTLSDEEVVREVAEDVKNLSSLAGYPVVGMAYPNGDVDSRVARLIREHTPIRYARTVASTHSFGLPQGDLLLLNPSVFTGEDCLLSLAEQFVALKPDQPALFYVWGHGYEYDFNYPSWQTLEKLFAMLSGKEDIFYCTNKEAFGIE